MLKSAGTIKISPLMAVAKVFSFKWIMTVNICAFGRRRRFKDGKAG